MPAAAGKLGPGPAQPLRLYAGTTVLVLERCAATQLNCYAMGLSIRMQAFRNCPPRVPFQPLLPPNCPPIGEF